MIKRKSQATEGEWLRSAYLSPAWTETHEKFEELLFKRFRVALDSPGQYAEATEDKFELG